MPKNRIVFYVYLFIMALAVIIIGSIRNNAVNDAVNDTATASWSMGLVGFFFIIYVVYRIAKSRFGKYIFYKIHGVSEDQQRYLLFGALFAPEKGAWKTLRFGILSRAVVKIQSLSLSLKNPHDLVNIT